MSPARLSPLNFSGLIGTMRLLEDQQSQGPEGGWRVEEVTMYRCTVCTEVHDDEDDAQACCKPKAVSAAAAITQLMVCPVCADSNFGSYLEVTNCCLWKDLPFVERERIATALDRGSDWLTELSVSRGRVVVHD